MFRGIERGLLPKLGRPSIWYFLFRIAGFASLISVVKWTFQVSSAITFSATRCERIRGKSLGDRYLVVSCVFNCKIQRIPGTLIDMCIFYELCRLLFLFKASSTVGRALTLRGARLRHFCPYYRCCFYICSEECRFMLWRWSMLLETSLFKQLLISQWSLFCHHEHCWRFFITNNNWFTLRIIQNMMFSTFCTWLKFTMLSHMLSLSWG